jgi:hypothetical protein
LRQKKPFLLVEVIVSITLLLLAGFSFFEIEKLLTQEARRNYYQVEAERIHNFALSTVIEELDSKKLSIDTLKRKEPYLLKLDNPNWKVFCNFTLDPADTEENDPLQNNFYLKVTFTLEHKDLGNFCVRNEQNAKPFIFFVTQNKPAIPDAEDEDDIDEE